MNGKIVVCLLTTVLLTTVSLADAQQTVKVPRIGFLGGGSPSSYSAPAEALRQGLKELGYFEGKNIIIESRYAEGKVGRLSELAAELVRLKVDIIVTSSTPATLAAKNATGTIPIVMANSAEPVGLGLITSLARPGGNVTGLTRLAPEIAGKRLELLKEAFPRVSRVGVLWNPDNPSGVPAFKEMQAAADALGVQLQSLEVRGPSDFDNAFSAISEKRVGALLVLRDAITISHQARIVDFTAKSRLPVIYDGPESVDAGSLMSYGANDADLYRRAATFVDKILKGAKLADLPVEQPMKFELIINLKAAKQIGLTIPPNVLARADRVIK